MKAHAMLHFLSHSRCSYNRSQDRNGYTESNPLKHEEVIMHVHSRIVMP